MQVLRCSIYALATLSVVSSAFAAEDLEACKTTAGDPGIAVCTKLIEAGKLAKPDKANAHYYRGVKYWAKRDYDRSIPDLTEAIKLNPKHADAYGNRGWVWHLKGDEDRAIADAAAAIKLNPKLDYPYYNRGVSWQAKGDAVRAIADY